MNKRTKLKTLLTSAGMVIALSANTAFAKKPQVFYHDWYLGGSVGGSVGKTGDDNPTIMYSGITDEYPTNSNSSTSVLLSLNGGYEYLFPKQGVSIAAGLGFYYAGAYKYKGNLIETASGGTPTQLYNYSYDVKSYRLMLEGQVNWIFGNIAPFVNAGIGPAWNEARGYKEIPDSGSIYDPLDRFDNNTITSLAFQIGFGISYLFNFGDNFSPLQSERLSLGYRYVQLGKVEFATRQSSYPYKLDTGTFRANEAYLLYTHYM